MQSHWTDDDEGITGIVPLWRFRCHSCWDIKQRIQVDLRSSPSGF